MVVSGRYPQRHGKGDAGRLAVLLPALARRFEVTLLTSSAPPSENDRREAEASARVVSAPLGKLARVGGALAAPLRGVPAQVGWMTPQRWWKRARNECDHADVVLAVTSRPVRSRVHPPLVVDHIDALSLNFARRAESLRPPLRAACRLEARLLARWERRLASWAAAQIVVAAADAAALPPVPTPHVLPHGYAGVIHLPDGIRDIDVIFTGTMPYPPNADAARWIAETIAPRIVAQRPATRIAIVGRGADRLRLGSGVEVVSDVPDLGAWLLRARVALAPLRIGTGAANKLYEAAGHGCAIVCTTSARAGVGLPAAVADDADGLALQVTKLLDDEQQRLQLAVAGGAALRTMTTDVLVERIVDVIEAAAVTRWR